jgi:putative FmdB family regulatory protein
MALYDYRCEKCLALMEIEHSIFAEAPNCPVCEIVMQRVPRPVRSIFRGSGWGRD